MAENEKMQKAGEIKNTKPSRGKASSAAIWKKAEVRPGIHSVGLKKNMCSTRKKSLQALFVGVHVTKKINSFIIMASGKVWKKQSRIVQHFFDCMSMGFSLIDAWHNLCIYHL